jgi:hypothetical protein
MKPGIERLDGDSVVFTDGSREQVDVIIWATGYDIKFPFFDDPQFTADSDNRPPPLFKRIMKPDAPDLFYMGLAQPLPTLVNFAEQQSKLVAAYLAGEYAPPSSAEMYDIIAADEAYHTGQYYAARRHTIQLDFDHYVRDLLKEIERGKKRAEGAGKHRSLESA